ncbi:MAG TPA: hypothetical protein VLL82_15510 [Mycobacterium sp.]|nr:hypothetical protein [Mycobacterium sp.]
MDRAQRVGQLRADVTFADVLMALVQLTHPYPGIAADRFIARSLQVYLDGLAAPPHTDLAGRAPMLDDLRRIRTAK